MLEQKIIPEILKNNVEMPIRSEDIHNFKQWVNWNPFDKEHEGIDFSLYQSADGGYQLGLPAGTPVRAVANGRLVANDLPDNVSPSESKLREFYRTVVIKHHGNFATQYAHIRSELSIGQTVKAGEIIGVLVEFSPSPDCGKITHLHFGCGSYSGNQQCKSDLDEYYDPNVIIPTKLTLTTTPRHEFGTLTLNPTGKSIHPATKFRFLIK